MYQRNLGKTGLKVSVIGFGSSQFRYKEPQDCALLLEEGYEMGINLYDTAKSYQNGEETIGYLKPEIRNELIIITKTGYRGGKGCLTDLQNSLKKIKRKWIDVWMTHMIQSEEEYNLCTDLGGFCDVAYSAKEAGLIRATGASFHAPIHVIQRAIKDKAFDVIMLQYNLIERETVFGTGIISHRDILIPSAYENGIGVIAIKILAGGELHHGAHKLRDLSFVNAPYDEIDISIRYSALYPYISSSVIGMINKEQIIKNIHAVDDIRNDNFKEFRKICRIFKDFNKVTCSRCGLCNIECPEKIDIAKIIRLYDQYRLYGMEKTACYKYNQLNCNVLNCTKCKKCLEKCNENIQIIGLLNDAHELLAHRSNFC